MINVILFDVGGTLLNVYPSVGAVYARVAAKHGIQAEPAVLQSRFFEAWEKQKSQNRVMTRGWWEHVVREVFAPFPFSQWPALFEDLYQTFAQPDVWKVYDDVLPTLNALKGKYRLAVASNWDERLPALLKNLGLADYFETMFVSGLMGIAKPNPGFFHRALQTLKSPAEETLHIGNDPDEDWKAARKAGLHALLLDRRQHVSTPHLLARLMDLSSRLNDDTKHAY